MSWRTVHLAQAKCSRVLENRGRVFNRFRWFRPGLLAGEAATANSAVIGCHSVDAMDVGGQKRSWADVSGRPPPVLKTAGLTSACVHQRPPMFERRPLKSTYVRHRPQTSVGLSLIHISEPTRLG